MIGCWIGFGVVCFLLLLGWLRRNREGLPFGGGERIGNALVVILGIALPIALLSGLFFWSDIVVIRSTAAPTRGSTRLTVRVIGHQWWWEVRYPGTRAVTANEIHIPVRVPVDVVGTTDDVIHSFWIPQLNRKIDLIPGRRNHVLLEANEPGIYEGECAEFCGLQHAHMVATVIADPKPVFRAVAREHGEAGARTVEAVGGARTRRVPRRRAAPSATGSAARPPTATSGPTSHTSRRGGSSPPAPSSTTTSTWQAGSPIRSTSSPATGCRRCR